MGFSIVADEVMAIPRTSRVRRIFYFVRLFLLEGHPAQKAIKRKSGKEHFRPSKEYFRPPPHISLIYSGSLRDIEVKHMSAFEEIEDCSWQEVYILNRCYDQFEVQN